MLRELALLHASQWGQFPAREARSDSTRKFFDDCREKYRPFLTGIVSAEAMEQLERYSDVIVPWDERADQHGRTLIHVDLHPGNVLFPRDSSDRVVLVDWQAWRAGPAARDVAAHLVLCLDEDDRAAHKRTLVSEYGGFLRDCGVDYDEQTAWSDYRIGAARQWLFAVTFARQQGIWDDAARATVPYLFPRAARAALAALNDDSLNV